MLRRQASAHKGTCGQTYFARSRDGPKETLPNLVNPPREIFPEEVLVVRPESGSYLLIWLAPCTKMLFQIGSFAGTVVGR